MNIAGTEQPILDFRGVTFHFEDKTILDNLDLAVKRGERLVVMGPSGTGKSTLLRLIIATLSPDRGSIFVRGQDVTRLKRRKLNRLRTHMGMVFQYSALLSSLTVRENLALPLEELTTKPDIEIEAVVDEKLRFVGLPQTKALMPAELSGGMRKRIAVARALMMEPELVLFDEPTAGLDPIAGSVINQLIIHVNETANATCIVVTHEMHSAFQVATRMAMLHAGKICEEDTPENSRHSQNAIVAQFLSAETQGPLTEEVMHG